MDVNEILEQYLDSPEDLKEILKDEAPSKIKELSDNVGQAIKEIIDDEDNETMLDIYRDMQQRFKKVFKQLLGNANDKVEDIKNMFNNYIKSLCYLSFLICFYIFILISLLFCYYA